MGLLPVQGGLVPLVFRQPRLVLGQPALIPGQAVLILSQPLPVPGQPVLVLDPPIVQLRLGVVQLAGRVRQLPGRVRQLPVQGVPPLPVVRPALVQLLPGVVQLPPAVRQLLIRLRPGIVQLRLGLVQLRLGVPDEGFVPDLRPLRPQRVQAVQQGLRPVLILVAVAVQLPQALPGEVGGGVVVIGEVFPRHKQEGVHRAAAQGGGAPVGAHVQRAVHHAHDGVAGAGEIPLVFLLQGQLQGVPQLQPQLHQQQALGDALVGGLRQAAPLHLQQVEPLRQGAHADDAVHRRGIHRPGPLHLLHPVRRRQGVQILLGQPQGGQHPAVHEPGAVVVPVGGVLHVRRGGPQARQEGHRQRGQHQDGQKAAEGVPDLPDGVGGQAVFPRYHSISSTGVGAPLRSMAATLPFLMWITRSAMGVRAVLWVMTITVMPS